MFVSSVVSSATYGQYYLSGKHHAKKTCHEITAPSHRGRSISNLHFADDIDLMTRTSNQLPDIINSLTDNLTAHQTEVMTDKSKVTVNVNGYSDVHERRASRGGEQLEVLGSLPDLQVNYVA